MKKIANNKKFSLRVIYITLTLTTLIILFLLFSVHSDLSEIDNTILAAFFLSVFISNILITQNVLITPIEKLKKALTNVNSGNYAYRESIENRGELTEITSLVNSMASDFAQSFTYLQEVVKHKTEELEKKSAKIKAILSSVSDGILTTDEDGIITLHNKSIEALFQYNEGELIGKSINILIPGLYSEQHNSYTKGYAGDNETTIIGKERIFKAIKKSGDEFSISLVITKGESQNQIFYTGVIEDLTLTHLLENKLLTRESFFNSAFHESLIGLAILDETLSIVEVNKAFCEWTGYEISQIAGVNLSEILSEESIQEITQNENFKQLAVGNKIIKNVEFKSHNNGNMWGIVSLAVVFDDVLQSRRIILQAVDIQREKQLSDELQSRNIALEKINIELNQFAYIASHDLKSPLNAISKLISWIETDYGELFPEKANEYFDLVKSRCQRMGNLLDDLLEYSRVGRLEYDWETINLSNLANDIFEIQFKPEEFKLSCEDKELFLPKAPFELVLRNLISNSIKHHDTPETGKIEIKCKQEKHKYIIEYHDNGPGIAPHLQEKALQMFQTLKSRDTVEGSGMGLALIKRIVERYGGKIELHSDGENGLTVTTYWPEK